MQHFSIIIPTLNEEGTLPTLLQRLEEVSSINRLQPEIIFVDVNSTDSTCAIIRSYSGPLKVRLILREGKSDRAGAVAAGAQAAAHEYLVVMDADLSHPPEQIPELLIPLQADSADMTIGSRYLVHGSIKSWSFAKRTASRLVSLPAQLLTGLRDPLSGFFATHTRFFKDLPGNMSGFNISLELLMHQKPTFTIAEIPITFTYKENTVRK